MFDSFNRRINYLRISVTDLCNLRCEYCMPPEGVTRLSHSDILSFEEITAVAAAAIRLGVDKIRLTGGEPLLRRGILTLVEMLAELKGLKDFALTTNGILLPKFAADLRRGGLQRVNVSLDTVDPDRYRSITRGGELAAVLAGVDAAVAAGLKPVKLNCVVVTSPDEPDAQSVAAFGRARGLETRFIRRMNLRAGRFWRVFGGDGGNCATCNRLRLTSDGYLLPCLFSDTSFYVRTIGVEAALKMAVDEKPECGRTSGNQFHTIGG